MTETFDFEVERIIAEVRKGNHEKLTLQFPEGLKRRANEIVRSIQKQIPNIRINIYGEPCYGACDLPDKPEGLIVNFGHYPIPSIEFKSDVMYIPVMSKADPIPALAKALPLLKSPLGIVTTPQHIHQLTDIVNFLAEKKIRAIVGKGDERLFTEGQVLGCNVTSAKNIAAKVKMFVFIGTGDFHPLAVALGTGKEVLAVDPIVKESRSIEELKEKILRQRHGILASIDNDNATTFGIILSTKVGQRRKELAEEIRGKLEKAGKKQLLIEMGTITPPKLDAFQVDLITSRACADLEKLLDLTAKFIGPDTQCLFLKGEKANA